MLTARRCMAPISKAAHLAGSVVRARNSQPFVASLLSIPMGRSGFSVVYVPTRLLSGDAPSDAAQPPVPPAVAAWAAMPFIGDDEPPEAGCYVEAPRFSQEVFAGALGVRRLPSVPPSAAASEVSAEAASAAADELGDADDSLDAPAADAVATARVPTGDLGSRTASFAVRGDEDEVGGPQRVQDARDDENDDEGDELPPPEMFLQRSPLGGSAMALAMAGGPGAAVFPHGNSRKDPRATGQPTSSGTASSDVGRLASLETEMLGGVLRSTPRSPNY